MIINQVSLSGRQKKNTRYIKAKKANTYDEKGSQIAFPRYNKFSSFIPNIHSKKVSITSEYIPPPSEFLYSTPCC